MASTGKKGKKAKWIPANITDILAEPTTVPATQSWADAAEDEHETSSFGYGSRRAAGPVVLPSASRAARGGLTVDDDSIPTRPPYSAYMCNLPYDVDETAISELLVGLKIQNLRLPREGDRLKGYGYVDFEDRESLVDAMNIIDPTISGRKIRIDVSTQDNERRMGGSRGGRMGEREREYDPERTTGDWRSGPRSEAEPAPRSRGMERERPRERERDGSGGEPMKPGAWRDSERPAPEPPRTTYGGRDSFGRDRGGGGFEDRDRDRGFSRDGFRAAPDRDRFSRDGDRGGSRGFGERRGFGDRDGERRGFGDRDGERRGFGDRDGERRGFGDRDGERRGFGDRDGERRGFGDRDGERRGFGDRDGERRGFGDRDGERRGFGDRDGERRGFGDRDRERDAPREEGKPRERPKLNLLPRTVPRDPPAGADDNATEAKSEDEGARVAKPTAAAAAVFGGAKPVDTAAKEREIEERLKRKEEEAKKAEEPQRWGRRGESTADSKGPPKRNDDRGRESRSYRDTRERRDDKRDYSRDKDGRERDNRNSREYPRDADQARESRDGERRDASQDKALGAVEQSHGNGERAERSKERRDTDEEIELPQLKQKEVPNFVGTNKFSCLEDAAAENSN